MNTSPARASNTAEIDPKTSKVTRALLAACAVTAAALILVSPLLSPDTGEGGAEAVAGIAAERGAFTTSTILFTLGLLLLLPTAAGIAQLVRGGRGTGVTRTGAIMMMIGATGVALAAWSFFVVGRVATAPGVDAESMATAMDAGEGDPFIAMSWMIGSTFFFGVIVAAIGLAIAKAIPIWHAALLGLGAVAVFFSPGEGLVGLLVNLPICLGLALLAPRIMALPAEQYQTASDTTSSMSGDVQVPGPAVRRHTSPQATTPPITTGGPSIAAAPHPTSREDKTL